MTPIKTKRGTDISRSLVIIPYILFGKAETNDISNTFKAVPRKANNSETRSIYGAYMPAGGGNFQVNDENINECFDKDDSALICVGQIKSPDIRSSFSCVHIYILFFSIID